MQVAYDGLECEISLTPEEATQLVGVLDTYDTYIEYEDLAHTLCAAMLKAGVKIR